MAMLFHNPIQSSLDGSFGAGSSECYCQNAMVKRGRIGIGRESNLVSSGLFILHKYHYILNGMIC